MTAKYMYRNDIIDAIITLLRNQNTNTYRHLHEVPNNRIIYQEKNIADERKITGIHDKEIWVAPVSDIVNPLTVSQERHDFKIRIIVIVKSTWGIADKRKTIDIAEDIEKILLNNRTLPNTTSPTSHSNGIIRGPIEMEFRSYFLNNVTINIAALQFSVDKTTTVS